MDLGMAPAIVGRVTYTGDLGYEIWMKPEYQGYLFNELMAAGAEFGIRLFGLRALNALRLDKSYGSWSREYRPLYGPLEGWPWPLCGAHQGCGFHRQAGGGRGKGRWRRLRLRTFIVDARDADVIGDEPIYHGGAVCGWVTSGGYAHASGVSVAVGYVPKEIADEGEGWSIELLGKRHPARLQHTPLFDANLEHMRG